MSKTIGGSVAALASIGAIIGCESKSRALPADQAPPVALHPPSTLGPGDELEVKFYYAPELNVQQKVRPDGRISLQLIGEVDVAGKTPDQLDAVLQEGYAKHLKYPEVSVIVRFMYSRRIIVTGEVTRPGFLEMPTNLSLFEAIALAGGFNHVTANLKQVIVSRDDGAGRRVGYVVNMKDQYAGAPTKSFMLQPTDIVIIPRTAVVNVNQAIAQYVSNNIPGFGTGAVASQQIGDVSVYSRAGQ